MEEYEVEIVTELDEVEVICVVPLRHKKRSKSPSAWWRAARRPYKAAM